MINVISFFSQSEEDMRPDDEMADLIHKFTGGPILESTTCHQDDGAEFEVVTSRPRLSEHLPIVKREEPLCQLDWELHWDHDGRVLDHNELVKKIFQGGVDHNIRSEVWKFLLGYHDFHSTQKEREENFSVESEDIHQRMYEIATQNSPTTVQRNPPGGSENVWMSGTGMGQFNDQ